MQTGGTFALERMLANYIHATVNTRSVINVAFTYEPEGQNLTWKIPFNWKCTVCALTLCNHFHASVACALPGLWHKADSWHDRRCRSGEWNKLPSFCLSATSSGNTNKHYTTEIATNLWLWKVTTHWRAKTVTGTGNQKNFVWVTPTLQGCKVSNKMKWSNLAAHHTYQGLFR